MLKKLATYTIIPGNPGAPGKPGRPGYPPYCKTRYVTTTHYQAAASDPDVVPIIVASTQDVIRPETLSVISVSTPSRGGKEILFSSSAVAPSVGASINVSQTSSGTRYAGTVITRNKISSGNWHFLAHFTNSAAGSLSGTVYRNTLASGIQVNGYGTGSVSSSSVTGFSVTKKAIQTTVPVTTCYPGTAAVATIPPTAPTPSQIMTAINIGWNSSARSVQKVEGFYQSSFNKNSAGCFIGLDRKDKDGMHPKSYPYGVMIDGSGVKVFEFGQVVKTLANSYVASSVVRVYIQPDRTILYLIKTGSVSESYISSVIPHLFPLYAYGYIYGANDTVTDPAIAAGNVLFGRA